MDDACSGIHKLAIIGGGPAGVGVLVRAARLGYLPRLLESDVNGKLGLALIHGGPVETLGTGNLGEYIINSNTFAKSLVTSILEDKPDLDPPESIQGTFLAEIQSHPTAMKLMEAGNTTIGLTELGKFLATVGSYARLEMLKYSSTSSCYVNTMALGVERRNGLCRITIETQGGEKKTILAENILLAMGGKQDIPMELNAIYHPKTWLSDRVLREAGRNVLAEALAKEKEKKICIVGGSHSAFSVAWTLLHKMQLAKEKSWFQTKDITILHQSPIRCYYATKKEAEADGVIVDKIDKCGSVNTFTGLREDAKALYQSIQAGKESRVRLFQLKKHHTAVQTQAYESATAIIWCCGYRTNMIPILDEAGQEMIFKQHNQAIEIDLKGKLMQLPSDPIEWLFGIGVGFSLRAAFDEMHTETRADGVTVYHRRGATLVLAALFGTDVYGTDCTTFEQMVERCEKKRKDEKQTNETKIPTNIATTTKRLANVKINSPTTPTRMKSKGSIDKTSALVKRSSGKVLSSPRTPHASKYEQTTQNCVSPSTLRRRSSLNGMRRNTSHSSLRIDIQTSNNTIATANSCGKPRSVAGGGRDAIQAIRSSRSIPNQVEMLPSPVAVEL